MSAWLNVVPVTNMEISECVEQMQVARVDLFKPYQYIEHTCRKRVFFKTWPGSELVIVANAVFFSSESIKHHSSCAFKFKSLGWPLATCSYASVVSKCFQVGKLRGRCSYLQPILANTKTGFPSTPSPLWQYCSYVATLFGVDEINNDSDYGLLQTT